MNATKKLLFAAGIVLQLSASLFADAWVAAFQGFANISDPVAAATYVYNNRGSKSFGENQKTAKSLNNTPEALAVGLYMSTGILSSIAGKFKGAASLSDLDMALKATIAGNRSGGMVDDSGDMVGNSGNIVVNSADIIALQNELAEAQAEAGIYYNQLQDALAQIPAAQKAQQEADAAVLGQKNQEINDALSGGQQGADLFKNLIDITFGNIETGINSADMSIQSELQGYVKSKANSLQVAASASNKSRVLGRSSSKKMNKKSRK